MTRYPRSAHSTDPRAVAGNAGPESRIQCRGCGRDLRRERSVRTLAGLWCERCSPRAASYRCWGTRLDGAGCESPVARGGDRCHHHGGPQ